MPFSRSRLVLAAIKIRLLIGGKYQSGGFAYFIKRNFMIDIKTGNVFLETVNFIIRSSLTREEFLSSTLAIASRISVKNEPHCSFTTKAQKIAGHPFIITLYFNGSILTNVELYSDDNKFGTSWDDWSEEKELERKKFHETWLKNVLADAPYKYNWGRIESFYDAKGGSSSISIKYQGLDD